MEKQPVKRSSKSFRRLLKSGFLSLLLLPAAKYYLAAQPVISQAQANALSIAPAENQSLYTKSDIKFEVLIPNAKADSIILQNASTPANVTMRTMRKSQEFGENEGTKIELWFNFEKKGDYKLAPLSLLISNRRRTIPFAPVTIADNPEFLSPRVVILFPDGNTFYSDEAPDPKDKNYGKPFLNWETGKTIAFSVCLQYAVQLVQFNWEIPTESIFTQTKTYDILEIKYREKRYSDELIPVADFEWTSLAQGEKSFPKIKLTATAYNGYRNDIYIPDFKINFSEKTEEGAKTAEADLFDQSFNSFDDEVKRAEYEMAAKEAEYLDSAISKSDCQTLAELRHKERNEIFGWKKNVAARADFEAKLGINTSISEFYMGSFYFFALIVLISASLFIIFLKKRMVLPACLSSAALFFGLIFFIFVSVQKVKKYGISTGCKISSIPEESAKAESSIGAGNRVQITEEAGQWIYIQLGESGGWCRRDEVIFIN